MRLQDRIAVTLIELILVLVMIAIGGAMAYPRIQAGIENQQAKKALETLRSISNAVRLYELNNNGALPPSGELGSSVKAATGTAHVLLSRGYLKRTEFAPGFNYRINTKAVPPKFVATHASGRKITLAQSATIKGQDGNVTDTAGFLGPPS